MWHVWHLKGAIDAVFRVQAWQAWRELERNTQFGGSVTGKNILHIAGFKERTSGCKRETSVGRNMLPICEKSIHSSWGELTGACAFAMISTRTVPQRGCIDFGQTWRGAHVGLSENGVCPTPNLKFSGRKWWSTINCVFRIFSPESGC